MGIVIIVSYTYHSYLHCVFPDLDVENTRENSVLQEGAGIHANIVILSTAQPESAENKRSEIERAKPNGIHVALMIICLQICVDYPGELVCLCCKFEEKYCTFLFS